MRGPLALIAATRPAGAAATRTAILPVRLAVGGVAGFDLVPARSSVQPALR
jgi:hypothetical protein